MFTKESIRREQFDKIKTGNGIIAALDQSGGSVNKALEMYGLDNDGMDETAALEEMHRMRARIMSAPSFSQGSVLGAIIFRESLTRKIGGKPIPRYLWDTLGIVPFLKIDDGLDSSIQDAQLLRPIPDLAQRLETARAAGLFGTKKRSVIHEANPDGVHAVVMQQFDLGRRILEAGLVPILEPEVSIASTTKANAEVMLLRALREQLDALEPNQNVMLKLTLPEQPAFYDTLAAHPNVLRICALSGGHPQVKATELLRQQPAMIASFSRALVEGLSKSQTDDEFNKVLSARIASLTGHL
jgi:fructose-bisphosphate aldolase class I